MKIAVLAATALTLVGTGAAAGQIYQRLQFADPVDYEALVTLQTLRTRIIGYAKADRCPYAKRLAREARLSDLDTELRAICDGPPVRLWD